MISKSQYSSDNLVAGIKKIILLSLFFCLWPFNTQAHWVEVTGLQVKNVISVAFDPGNAANVYAGTDTENNSSTTGLYRSIDGTGTWSQITSTSLTGKPIRDISISPDNTATFQKMFLAVAGQGIFRSINGGVDWTATRIEFPENSSLFLTQNVSQVIVARQQGTTQKIYALVSDDQNGIPNSAGIFMSTDDGLSWSQVYQSDDIKKLVVHPNQPNTLFISTVSSGEILKSTNGGVTFTSANSGLPSNGVVVNFSLDPEDANRIYASVFSNSVGGFYRSVNGGTSWTRTNELVFAHIAVSSGDAVEGRLYAIRNEGSGSNIQYSVFQSADDGVTWARVARDNNGIPENTTLYTIAVDQEIVYVGGDNGLFKYDHNATVITDPTQADISLSVTATEALSLPQKTITYRMVVENLSQTQDATNVIVTSDSLPLGMRATGSNNSQECSYDTSTRRISCSIDRINLSDGQTFEMTLSLPNPLTVNQINAGFAVSSDNDDNLDNNQDQVSSFVAVDDGSDLIANNSSLIVSAGSSSVNGVLNVSSTVHDQVIYVITSQPQKGIVTFPAGQSQPNIVYTPNPGESGTDSFAYKIDAVGDAHESNIAVVTVSIAGGTEGPTGQGDSDSGGGVGSGALNPLLALLLLIAIGGFRDRRFK